MWHLPTFLVSFPILNLQIGHHHPHLHLVPPERMLFHTSLLFLRLPSFCLGACLSLSSHLHLSKSSSLDSAPTLPHMPLYFSSVALEKCCLSTKMGSCFLLFSHCLPLCLTHRIHVINVNWINVWRDEQIHEYYDCCCLASFGFILPSNSDGVTSCWEARSGWWLNISLCIDEFSFVLWPICILGKWCC